MNYSDFNVLIALKTNGNICIEKAITKDTLLEVILSDNRTKFSDSKLRNALKEFLNEKYIANGFKKGLFKTYYLTEDGYVFLNNILKAEKDMIKNKR